MFFQPLKAQIVISAKAKACSVNLVSVDGNEKPAGPAEYNGLRSRRISTPT